MRAWRVHTPGSPAESLRLEEVVPPEPGPAEVRIRVEAGNVNFADILLCEGVYQDRPPRPFTPGLETSGVVDAVGPGVTLAIGTRISGMAALPAGGYAEQALVRAPTALVIPDDMAPADAAVMYSTFQTAHVALHHRAHLRRGEWLLVHGAAGGVGSAAVQLGVAAGARVLATAGGPDKVAYADALGAYATIDHQRADVYAEVMRITQSRGVDVAFDPVGGSLGDVTRRLMAWEGRLVVVGFAAGAPVSYPGNHVLVKNYSVLGLHWAAYPAHGQREVIERAHEDLVRLYRQGAIVANISATIGLAEIPEALRALAERRVTGRIVLVL